METPSLMNLLNQDLQSIISVLEEKRNKDGKIDSIRLSFETIKYKSNMAKLQKHAFNKEDLVEKAKSFFRIVKDRKDKQTLRTTNK